MFWMTLQEIAELSGSLCLPTLPSTKRGMLKFAERERWQAHDALWRPRTGREGGGGLEYHIDLWPMVDRVAYLPKHFLLSSAEYVDLLKRESCGSAKLTGIRNAKLAVVMMADRFHQATGLTLIASDSYFSRHYAASNEPSLRWIKDILPEVSQRTIARYRAAIRADADALGVDPNAGRKGLGILNVANGGELRTFILARLAAGPHFSAKVLRRDCLAQFGPEISDHQGAFKQMPPLRTFQHFLKALKENEKVALTKLTNPDGFRNKFALSGAGALRHVVRPNQLWQIDASPVDALCTDGRHSIYICLDIATRRMVGYVSRTPRSEAVCLLTRKAILELGAPEKIYTDNGSDFVAKATERLFEALSIDVQRSDAYSPEQKGHVERAIKTFQHGLVETLPGYVGHSVADRKVIEGRKAFNQRLGEDERELFGVALSGAELQQRVDEWITYSYHHAEHAGLGRQTPHDVAARSTYARKAVDQRALDVLLMPVAGSGGIRVMSKRGIKIDHHHYITGAVLPGARVLVRMDPQDAGRALLFAPDGDEYLAEAVCIELAGLNPRDVLAAARQHQAELLGETIKSAKATMRELARNPNFHQRLRDHDRLAAEAKMATGPNVITLPRQTEEHTSDQIAAALDAATGPKRAPAAELTGRAAELHAEMLREQAQTVQPGVTRLRREETMHQRFRRALDMRAAVNAGRELEASDLIWLGGYESSPEYRGLKKTYDDFGGVISM